MAILHFFCDESGKYRKNPVVSITVGWPILALCKGGAAFR
jgi:hypothetical protein